MIPGCINSNMLSGGGEEFSETLPSSVYLALYMDDPVGGSTFTDSSTYNRTITPVGDPVISDTQVKFGSGSAFFDGSDSYIRTTLPVAAGTNDITLSFWYYPTASPTDGGNNTLTKLGGSSTHFALEHAQNGKVSLFLRPPDVSSQSTTVLSLNTWYHIVLTRTGSTWRVFINGVKEIEYVDNIDITNSSVQIGQDTVASRNVYGYIDDYYFIVGESFFITDFISPSVRGYDALVAIKQT